MVPPGVSSETGNRSIGKTPFVSGIEIRGNANVADTEGQGSRVLVLGKLQRKSYTFKVLLTSNNEKLFPRFALSILITACSYNMKFEKTGKMNVSQKKENVLIVDTSQYRSASGIQLSTYSVEYPFQAGHISEWQYHDFVDSVKNMGGNLVYIDSSIRADNFFSYYLYLRISGRVFYDSMLDKAMNERDSGEMLITRTDFNMGGLSPIDIFKGDSLLCKLKRNNVFRIRYKIGGKFDFNINKFYALKPKLFTLRDVKVMRRNTGGVSPDGGIYIGTGGLIVQEMNEFKYLFFGPLVPTGCADH